MILLGTFSGCADGPLVGLAAINPWMRQKWEEDERYGPTFHRRQAELRALRAEAPSMSPEQKERISADMAELVRGEPNPVLRAEAVSVVGELGIPSGLPTLGAATQDADTDVRVAACRAWGRTGGNPGLAALVDIVQRDEDVDVRLAALTELAQFREQAAIEALGIALDDLDPAIQHRAVQSLKRATGLDYGDSVPRWREYVQGRQPEPAAPTSLVERLTNWL